MGDTKERRPVIIVEYADGSAALEVGDEKPLILSAEELAVLRSFLALPSAKRGPL